MNIICMCGRSEKWKPAGRNIYCRKCRAVLCQGKAIKKAAASGNAAVK